MDPAAAVCVRCGVPVGSGNKYCQNCAAETSPDAVYCPSCGASLQGPARGAYTYSGNGAGGAYAYRAPDQPCSTRSKVAAGVLGILLGGLGVHNFYLGFTSRGVAQLLISVLSCGILSPISAIWGLIEGILILMGDRPFDADGLPLRD